jgi:tyrosine-protein kinase
VYQFARRWWWLAVLCTVLAAGASYATSTQLPRVYESTAKLVVTPGQPAATGSSYNDVLAAERLTRTYAEVLRTPAVIETAASNAGSDVSYEDALRRVNVRPVRDTQLIEISAQASDPQQAARFANEIANVFIRQTEDSQSERFRTSKESLASQVARLGSDIGERTRQIEVLRATPPSVNRDAEIAQIQSEVAQLQQSSASAVRSFEDVRLAEARGMDQLALVQPATASTTSLVQPRTVLNVLLAIVAGWLIAILVAITIEYVDDRVRTPERLQRFSGLLALGSITSLPKAAPRGVDLMASTSQPTSSDGYGDHGAVESYRLLRTNLQFAAVERPLKTLLVTSAEVAEGKTTTSANLAIVLAQAGERVLLIDADLRRPTQHTFFSISNRDGLTSLLLDDARDPTSSIVQTRVSGLSLIPSGFLPPNPSELLASQRMRTRLADLASRFDIVIIDSPPALAVSDPAALSGVADGVLVVVHATRTHGQRLGHAVTMLEKAGGRLLGAVLNATPPRASVYYASPQAYDARPTTTSA